MKVKLIHEANGDALYVNDVHVAGVKPYSYIMPDETTLNLPCKVGEKLWVLHRLTKIPTQVIVDGYQYNGDVIFVRYHDEGTCDSAVLGRGIFASKEDAVKKLFNSESDNPFIEQAKQLVEMEMNGTLHENFDIEAAIHDRIFIDFLCQCLSAEEAVKKYAELKEQEKE